MPTVTHVLFDVDGLLLDTEKLYTVVTEEILAPYGRTFDFALKARMMGKRAPEACRLLVEETGIPLTADEFRVRREEGLARLFPHCDLLPGAERLIRHLRLSGVPIAVATSAALDSFRLKTSAKHQALFDLFDVIVTGDDPAVVNGKPAPDIFRVAASRLHPAPAALDNVLVFEDAPNGVQAAHAAGMPVVMVPDTRVPPEDRALATQVLTSLEDFVPEAWGLPPFAAGAGGQ